ncbi:Y-family DNA polymerase [Vibrio pomeroyi]|uniref:Y-family DNA polymerase n=1 Tax=Vibrio pomeroyi TaxID=198832 RepID=A0ABV4MQY7_9VIBR|nr:Y-family DNA polymerase [Vibrio atlanticus]MCZ4311060.1 Y-family DNA polymerase [Vibrio atlanticus]
MIGLIDANSFYCSAETVFRPDWRGKPIVVLSNNDGAAVAVNRQAKDLGIPKFKPYFEIKAQCELHKVIVLSSNYELYSHISANMMQVIGRFSPNFHVYSIDEAFLDYRRCDKAIPDFRAEGALIRRTVWKECRLAVCAGFGETLTLSKIANHAAKKLPGYNGVCVLDTQEETTRVLGLLDAGSVWGIGRKLSTRLQFMGVNTALDLARLSPSKARKDFSVEVERIVRELNGERCKHWDSSRADKKQIFSTRSVGARIDNLLELQQALSTHAGIASRKARKQNSLCKVMICFASNSPFDDKPVSFKTVKRFPYPTADVTQITKAATELAKELYRDGVRYYRIGVGFIELVDGEHEQGDLFNPTPNDEKLMQVFDGLNHRFGTDTVFLGAQGIQQKWKMRRDKLTPQYTTRWTDLPNIKCK